MAAIAGSRTLVTGATGFLGSHLCRRLVELGTHVHVMRRPNSRPSFQSSRVWDCDLDDTACIRRVLIAVRPDYVFHLAGSTSASRDLRQVALTTEANLLSTISLLSAVAEVGCKRMVLAGSMEEPTDLAAAPSSPYAASKLMAGVYARMFWQLYQTPVTIARIFMAYGPGQSDVRKLVPYAILSLLRHMAPKISSGTRPVDWVYIDDVISGLVAIAEADGLEGLDVDVGSGVLTPVREVVLSIARMIEPGIEPDFGSVADRPLEQVRRADIERTRLLVGWQPTVDLHDGLLRTIEYYREQLELHLS